MKTSSKLFRLWWGTSIIEEARYVRALDEQSLYDLYIGTQEADPRTLRGLQHRIAHREILARGTMTAIIPPLIILPPEEKIMVHVGDMHA